MEDALLPSPTKGRKKPPTVMIRDSAARHVCFTKRRKGLFKKICELSTLCGTDSLAFVTSPAGKLYSIGTSDVPAAVDRFLIMYGRGDADGQQPPEDRDGDATEMMNEQDRQIIGKLYHEVGELEKKSSELRELRAIMQRTVAEKSSVLPHRWDSKIGDLPILELEEMLVALKGLLAKMGIDLLEEMRQRSVSVNNISGNIAQGSTSFGPLNVTYPMRYYPSPLPQAMNPSSFATTSWGPANFAAPVTFFNLNPSHIPSPLNFLQTPPVLHYPSPPPLMTPVVAHSGGPSSSCSRPPAGHPQRLPPQELNTPDIPMTTFCAPSPSDGASWNLSSTTPVQRMPATHNQVNALSFTNIDVAPATCSAISLNPPMFSSSATLPTLQLKEYNSRITQPANCNMSNAIITTTPPCMASNGTTKNLDFQSDAAGEECSLVGDAFPSSDSGNIPWELFDIPPDFDFARDWSA